MEKLKMESVNLTEQNIENYRDIGVGKWSWEMSKFEPICIV